MPEKVKEYQEKALAALKKISKKTYIALFAVIAIVVAVIVALTLNRPYAVLFTGMSSEETSAVLAYLDGQGITNYRIESNNTVLVPKEQENRLKADLILAGYPKQGFSYSTYYDNVNALSTESERNTAYLLTMVDKMESVIRCFSGVKDAHVIITQGEDRSYVLDSGNVVKASASVQVEMNSGATMTNQYAAAIRNYVAHAVQGLEIDSVIITDTLGNLYSGTDSATGDSDSSALKLQLEEQYSNKIRTQIMQALLPAYGEGNVLVGVSCVVEVSNTVEDSTQVYLPPFAANGETNGRGIIGSEIYSTSAARGGDDTVGGLVGTETNSDLPEYVEDLYRPDGTEQEYEVSGQRDYDNSRSEKHIIRTAGYLTDCTVAVTINSDVGVNESDATIRKHIAMAAGISYGGVAATQPELTEDDYLSSKISVLITPFYNPDAEVPGGEVTGLIPGVAIPTWALIAAAAGLLLFLILLIILLILGRKRRKKKKLKNAQNLEGVSPEQILNAALAGEVPESGADVMGLQSERSMELRREIRKFAEENPELAAQLIRTWLRGGEENGE